MKVGTLIELPDGRRGVVVYNGLDGYGVRLGKESLSEEELSSIMSGNADVARMLSHDEAGDIGLVPTAMLRDPYPSAECECVGTEYTIIR